MILILSQGYFETSTEDIFQWLEFFKENVRRINGEDLIDEFQSNINSQEFHINQEKINVNEVKVIFYRRYASFSDVLKIFQKDSYGDAKFSNKVERHLANEHSKIYDFWLSHFTDSVKVSSFLQEKELNKLVVLKIAEKVGLKIPDTFIINRKERLEEFLKIHDEYVTKPVSECQFFIDGQVHYKMLTEIVSKKNLAEIPEKFFPSCIQEKIVKKYEIRTFFINDTCYSMAIFSQQNENTSVDFRNYDLEKPNRTVPYCLPYEIEVKIVNLMKEVGLTTGSIDLIKSITEEYVFLEINPNGQFGMTSYPCNYYLEKIIAENLIELAHD